MGMPILKSGTFLLVESGILKICLVESGILGFAIWNTAQGIRNPTKDCNPESTDKESGIHGVESRIQDFLKFPYMR